MRPKKRVTDLSTSLSHLLRGTKRKTMMRLVESYSNKVFHPYAMDCYHYTLRTIIRTGTSSRIRLITMSLLTNRTSAHPTATLKIRSAENLSSRSKKIKHFICAFSFLLSDEIGNGSFGRVYQGFDNDHGVVMAVKQVPIMNLSST